MPPIPRNGAPIEQGPRRVLPKRKGGSRAGDGHDAEAPVGLKYGEKWCWESLILIDLRCDTVPMAWVVACGVSPTPNRPAPRRAAETCW
jgi:hypothetical protein